MEVPLRLTHYLPSIRLADGGVVRAVLDWCAVFATRGHHVTLLTFAPDDVPAPWLAGAPGTPKVVTLGGGRPRDWLNSNDLARATEVLGESDALHLHSPWLKSNLQLSRIARRLGLPYLVTIHGMLDDWPMTQRTFKKRLFLALFARKWIERAARVHCTAAAEWRQASTRIAHLSPLVLPYLVDVAPFANLPGPLPAQTRFPALRASEPKLLYLSRLHEKKGVDQLIRAAALLRDSGTACQLFIAGTGDPAYEKLLRDLASELKLTDRVHFLGLVSGVEKISLFQAANLFVLPTSQENFGLVLTESLACETPVITTRGVDIYEELQQAGATIIEPTPEAIAKAVQTLLPEVMGSKRLGDQGRRWVMDFLDPDRLAESYEAIYRAMAQSQRKTPLPQA